MSALDITLLVIMVYAIIRGIMKGLVMEVASLVGIVVSLFVAKNFGESLMGKIVAFFGIETEVNSIVSFVIVFILAMILVRFLAIMISKLVKFAMLGWLDKLLGAIASLVKCLLILGAMLYSFDKVNNFIHFVSPETLAKSKLYEPVKSMAHIVFPSESDKEEESSSESL